MASSVMAANRAMWSMNGGAENAGVENAGGITYGKPSEQKTLKISGV